MLTITQAAKFLKVSSKTLRRWEKQGHLIPARTTGNQRRYSLDQITNFTKPPRVSLSPLTPLHLPDGFVPNLTLPPLKLFPAQKKIIVGVVASLVVAISAVIYTHSNFPQAVQIARDALRHPTATTQLTQNLLNPTVLASETAVDDYLFNVNIASQFKDLVLFDSNVTVSGQLTAPNVVYNLIAGDNVTLTGGTQTPTISVDIPDQTTDLDIFKTIKVGSTTFSAGSLTDTLTFAAGDNVSISSNTTDKKITIKSAITDVTTSGWTDDGTILRLTAAGDLVSIGSATGSAKLAIEGGGYAGDILTASQSGNLLLKLTNTGTLTLADDLAVNGGDLTTTQTTFDLLNATATTVNFAGAATTLSLGATTGTTTINNDLTIGNAITDAITFTARVAQDSDLIPITATGTNDLGSSALPWDNLYLTATTGDVFYASTTNTVAKLGIGSDGQALTVSSGVPIWAGGSGSGTVGWWQRNLGVLSPTNITDDLAVGGTATSSALFQVGGLTGNIITAGDIAVNGADITTTSTGTATVFNTTATTVNLAGAGTTISIGAGSGTTTINNSAVVTGDLGVNGGDITSSATSFNLLQSTVTTLNLGGAATTVSLGASTGTTTINNANTIVSGDLAINGGDLTTSATTFNLVNATATTVNLAGAATTLSIGAATGTTTINNALSVLGSFTLGDNGDTGSINTSDWDVSTTGDLTGIGAITSDGAISFTPGTTTDITFTTDADSTFVVSGLATSSGSGLCLDGSNNVIICSSGSGSSLWTLSTSTIYPNLASYDTLIGSITATDGVGKFTVSGSKTGKALVVLNETGNQNILEASASGVPVFSLERDGDFVFEGATNNDFETLLAVSDPSADRTVTIPNATGTICLDSDNCTGGTAGPWGETSGVVILDTSTNNVTLGGSSNLGKLGVDGDTDEVQLLIQANSSQTANLLTLENSSGTDQSWFDETGNLRVGTAAADTGLVNVTGAFTGKALVILDETGDQAIWSASASGTTVATLGRTGNLTVTDSSSSNIDFNLSSTGDFTVSDAGTPFATFTDAGVFTLDSLNLDATTIGLTTDTDLLSLAANELTVNGSIVATADVAVNGGDLTSTATTFNLLQSTVTTLNLGGAATTLSIGASTGTTTVNNDLTASGTLTANGTLTVNSDIITLGNAITDAVTFTARVAADSDLIPIGTTGTNDLGATALPWDNLYVTGITQNGAALDATYAPINANFVTVTANGTLTGETGIDALTTPVSTTSTAAIGTATAIGKLTVQGKVTGKANTILDETGDQNILVASASGVNKLIVANNGDLSVGGVIQGTSGTNTRLQATGATAGDGNGASTYFLNSSGSTRARIDTAFTSNIDLTVSSGTTTINDTATKISTTSSSGQAVVTVTSTTGFTAGNKVLLIQMLGTGVGDYEENTILSIDSATQMTMASNLTNTYTENASSDAQVIQIPVYRNVTLTGSSTLTAPAWDGSTGGVLYFKAAGTLSVGASAIIDMNGKGFTGGSGGAGGAGDTTTTGTGTGGSAGSAGNGPGGGGASTAGGGGPSSNASGDNGGDGGAGGGNGAGGSYGAAAANGGSGGNGGQAGETNSGAAPSGGAGGSAASAQGCADFSDSSGCLFAGSGGSGGAGGGGGGDGDDGDGGTGGTGGAGGTGGGIVSIFANTISNSGTIRASGSVGTTGTVGTAGTTGDGADTDMGGGGGGGAGGAGGSGSGGSIWLSAPTVTVGTVTATGGAAVTTAAGGIGGACDSSATGDGGGGGGGGEGTAAGGSTSCSSAGSAGGDGGQGSAGGNGRTKCDDTDGSCSGGTVSPSFGSGEAQTSGPSETATFAKLYIGEISATGLTTPSTTFDLVNTTATTVNLAGAATTLSIGATTGTTTINNDLTIGNAITDAITFTAQVAADSDLIPIGTTGTNDLGASALPWDNLYVNNIVVPTTGTGQVGYWTRTAGVLSPAITNDVLAATTSATVAMTLTQTGAFNALLVEDSASDTTPFVIDQSGNVGIGTTAPGTIAGQALKLDVNGYAGIGGLRIKGSDTGNTIYSEQTAMVLSTGGGTNQHIALMPNGNVGIGTTGPLVKLDVGPIGGAQSATAGSLGLIRNNAAADTSPYTQPRLIIYGGTGVDTSNWAYFGYGSDAQLRQVYSKTSSGASMLWGTTSASDGTGTFTQTMSLTAGGALTAADFICTDCLGQGDIGASAIGTGELKTAQASSSPTGGDVALNDYSFSPNMQRATCNVSSTITISTTADSADTIARFGLSQTCGSGTHVIRWRYVTASDHPSIWVVANSDGTISTVWQAEDPVKQFEYPENRNPIDGIPLLTGQRYISVVPLTISELRSLLSSLPESDQVEILSDLSAYIKERGWLESLTSIDDLVGIGGRYEPSARLWAMRFTAQHFNIDPTELISGTMAVNVGDELVIKDNFYQTLQTYLTTRQQQLDQIKAEEDTAKALPPSQQSADLAEWYSVQEGQTPEAGDLVSFGTPGMQGFIVKANTPYDPHLMGIVSTNPHTTLGKKTSPNNVRIALTGRVPVKIDPDSEPIEVGDFLTSSDKPGLAMKATKAGYTVGKALEAWQPGAGTELVEVFVNLGYYMGPLTADGYLNTEEKFIAADIKIQLDPAVIASLQPKLQISNPETVDVAVESAPPTSAETEISVAAALSSLLHRLEAVETQLSDLKLNTPPVSPPNLEGDESGGMWVYATESGKLVTAFPVQTADLTVVGKLQVGLLAFDDLEASISSLTGEITIKGDLVVTGSLKVLGQSAGKAIIPAGEIEIEIENSNMASDSAIFVTPENFPIPVAAQPTPPGQFVLRIPAALPEDLKVNWWVVN